MANVARRPTWLNEKSDFVYHDDFLWYVTAHMWTSLAADGGTSVAVGDAIQGRVTLTTGATDNNEAGIRTTNELFLMAAGKPMWCLARMQYTEANTDDANVMFGFISAFGANNLVDDGAGVRTTGNYAVIYKIDGGTVWRCSSRNGTEVTDSVSTTTAGGASYQELEIEVVEYSTLSCEIVYKVDGVYLVDSTTNLRIAHRLLYASATEMHCGAYVKAGGANSETPVVDYIDFGQVR